MMNPDSHPERLIAISGLRVMACVGVPQEERSSPQRLLIDARFAASSQPSDLGDDLANTVDYHSLSRRIIAITGERPRSLIETLADEMADLLMREYPLRWLEISIRKFILSDAEHVSVTVRRTFQSKISTT